MNTISRWIKIRSQSKKDLVLISDKNLYIMRPIDYTRGNRKR